MLPQLIFASGRCSVIINSSWKSTVRAHNIFQLTRMASSNQGSQKCRVVKEEELARGKWLYLSNHHWIDHSERKRVWEVVGRTTKGCQAQDCVTVVAKVSRKNHPDAVVLIKQFRPPLKSYTIEMPAGLVDDGESIEEAALRELKEETGYTGTITSIGSNVALDPGLSSATMKIVTVKVDGDATVNQNISKICGVEGEHIEVLLVPLKYLHKSLAEFAANGFINDSRLEALALGYSMTSDNIL